MGDDIEYKTVHFEQGIIEYSRGYEVGRLEAEGWRIVGWLISDMTGRHYAVFERRKTMQAE